MCKEMHSYSTYFHNQVPKTFFQASLKTFPLALTPELAGLATVVVYTAARDGEVVADALTFPVDTLTRKGLTVSLHQDSDPHMMTLTVTALPGSTVALSGSHWESYSLQAGNDLSHAKVRHSFQFVY